LKGLTRGCRASLNESNTVYCGPMPGIARLNVFALDCPDPQGLAAFYSAITGWEVGDDGGDWVELRNESGPTLAFQLAPDHQAPVWPSADRPQQAHIDFAVRDLDHGETEVLALGARKTEFQPGGEEFRVYLDPAGHPFCLVVEGH
jgi:catechol 2,3-dioxygenase-like lactoylglutathione lyase family enzyme